MRESNHCFPSQNKACVCINTQMYDRRALDTAAPLPLFNSLTHLVYLTSTSPRIREIMTQDGGLERMVRMLHDYCMSPPPPENPAMIYGLTPPNARPPKPTPTLNPTSFDKHAAFRFSLAFQCVVNVGVRGSEQIRTRVVQAGTLDVVGCVLEAWLASKGFAVGPSSSATGLPRESKEQRQARKQAQLEQRQREEAAQLQRALQRQLLMEQQHQRNDDSSMDVSPSPSPLSHASTPGANSDNDSVAATPLGSGTPTGSVVIPNRDRSGTLVAPRRSPAPSDTSRAETETEDDGDVDMERPRQSRRGNEGDAHIIINQGGSGVGDVVEVAVDDEMVSLDAATNDDFAMGAPPGAPGAITDGPVTTAAARRRNTIDAPDVTPRAGFIGLPDPTPTMRVTHTQPTPIVQRTATIRNRNNHDNPAPPAAGLASFGARSNSHHARETESGPYKDEDVLFGLQLLAYLSKYPHVRQAFYKPRASFHPATVNYANARYGTSTATPPASAFSAREKEKMKEQPGKDARSRGKERASSSFSSAQQPVVTAPPQNRQTNVFSLVERFTFKPSSTETELPNPPPRLPPEIQYWAGVIMRNACRKDETRGGIRQCANMLCGRWESYPREFAKCRRCRKAKYCGKECQSTAWSEGHRFWCSAKDADDDMTGDPSSSSHHGSSHSSTTSANTTIDDATRSTGTGHSASAPPPGSRRERDRTMRDRDRTRSSREADSAPLRSLRTGGWTASTSPTTTAVPTSSMGSAPSPTSPSRPGRSGASSAPRAEMSMSRDRTLQPGHPGSGSGSRTAQAQLISSSGTVTGISSRSGPPPNVDPLNTSYLSFAGAGMGVGQHGSGNAILQPQPGLGPVRRRAETITPSSVGRSVGGVAGGEESGGEDADMVLG